jgi:hypothetical protein
MEIKELLNLAADIRETLNEERANRRLIFEEEEHKYTIYDKESDRNIDTLPSVSALLKQWYEPFDSLTKSLEMSNGDETQAQDLRGEWEKKGEDASSLGSYVHYKLEQYIWSLYDINKDTRKPKYDLRGSELLTAQKMVKNGINLMHTIIENGFVPIDTEVIMGSVELGYFGQCDNMWLGHTDSGLVLLMTDHKTNKTKNFETSPWNIPMHKPFERLLDTSKSVYYVQQPLYAQLFRDMLKNTPYKDIPFAGFRILHVRDEGKIIKVPTWVYDEVQKLYPVK